MKVFGSCQAITPEDATMFETVAEATKTGDEVMPRNRQWRVDPFAHRGEPMFIVKHWPKHKTEICAERRWLKVGHTKPKRKDNGEED